MENGSSQAFIYNGLFTLPRGSWGFTGNAVSCQWFVLSTKYCYMLLHALFCETDFVGDVTGTESSDILCGLGLFC